MNILFLGKIVSGCFVPKTVYVSHIFNKLPNFLKYHCPLACCRSIGRDFRTISKPGPQDLKSVVHIKIPSSYDKFKHGKDVYAH
jgi:hypothetical protein